MTPPPRVPWARFRGVLKLGQPVLTVHIAAGGSPLVTKVREHLANKDSPDGPQIQQQFNRSATLTPNWLRLLRTIAQVSSYKPCYFFPK